jgi:Predicted integral membrane protein (DUF2269)
MSVYTNILFLHFLGMAGLFIGYGLEWTSTTFLRKATTAQAVRNSLGTYSISLPLSGPALLLLILTGGYMAGVTGISKAGWILATAVSIIVALGIGFALVMPRMKAIKAALPAGDAVLSADALARVQNPAIVTLIRIRAFLALGIVYLMTTKPPIGVSFAVLLGAAILGVLFSLSVWTKQAA